MGFFCLIPYHICNGFYVGECCYKFITMRHIINLLWLFALLAFIAYLLLIFTNPNPTIEERRAAVGFFFYGYFLVFMAYLLYQDFR